jgi:hypothetical protein
VKCSCKTLKSSSQPPTPILAPDAVPDAVPDSAPPLEEPVAPVNGGAESSSGTGASANGPGNASKLHTGRSVSLSANLSAGAKAFLTGKPSPAVLPAPAAASVPTSHGGMAAASAASHGADGVKRCSLESRSACAEGAAAGAPGESTQAHAVSTGNIVKPNFSAQRQHALEESQD